LYSGLLPVTIYIIDEPEGAVEMFVKVPV
jgi:hypothetical protein